jgi:hypothetical protein
LQGALWVALATKATSDSLLQWWCREQQLRRQVAFQLAVRSLRNINITTATCRMWADRPHACMLGRSWCKEERSLRPVCAGEDEDAGLAVWYLRKADCTARATTRLRRWRRRYTTAFG